MTSKRPFLLYILIFIFLLFSAFSVFGVIETIQSWNWLRAFEVTPHPVYLIFKNSFLALVLFTAGISLWIRTEWAPAFGCCSALLFFAWFWVDRIILTQNPVPLSRHLLLILISCVLLALTTISTYLMKPFMKNSTIIDDSIPVNSEKDPYEKTAS